LAGSLTQDPSAEQSRGELAGNWPEGQVNGTFDPYMKVFDNKITPASILGYPQDIPA